MKVAAACIVVAVLLAVILGRTEGSRMPQTAQGDDVLSVAFADAKATISAAMVHKADSYFHGGIDIDCHEAHEHPHDRGGHGVHQHEGEHADGRESPASDPWRWINCHVRAPEKHVHLDGDEAVELMPWFWASVRADPHNIEAWTAAWYAANSMLKDKKLARRIIDEAKAKNPDSLEIAWTEARFVYDGGNGDVASAERILGNARAMGRRKCGGRLSDLSPHEAEVYCNILEYLAKIHQGRGDKAYVRALAEEAKATGADTPVVEWIANLGRQ